jgi:hypothetical protein
MKKTLSKLALNRETLRNLSERALGGVRGGATLKTCAAQCVVKTEDCETKVSCDLTNDCTWQTEPLPR